MGFQQGLAGLNAAARKIKDTKIAPDAVQDAQQQLQRLVPKNFLTAAPWPQLLVGRPCG